MAYSTLALLKLAMQKGDNDADALLSIFLEASTRAIDNFCHRPDGFIAKTVATAHFYRGSGGTTQYIDECIEVEAVAVKESPTSTDYTAWTAPTTNMAGDGDWIAFAGSTEEPNFNRRPYNALMIDPNGDNPWFTGGKSNQDRSFGSSGGSTLAALPTVRVTAKWGYSVEVPEDIRAACQMQAMIWYKRQQGSGATVLANADLGSLEIFATIDPMVKLILSMGGYVVPATGAAV